MPEKMLSDINSDFFRVLLNSRGFTIFNCDHWFSSGEDIFVTSYL